MRTTLLVFMLAASMTAQQQPGNSNSLPPSVSGGGGGGTGPINAYAMNLPDFGLAVDGVYAPINGVGSPTAATEAANQMIVSAATTLTPLVMSFSLAPGMGNTVTLSARKNGVQAATCTISGVALSCTDTTSVAVVAGDKLSYLFSTTGTPGGSASIYISWAQAGAAGPTGATGPTGPAYSVPTVNCSGSGTSQALGCANYTNQGNGTVSITLLASPATGDYILADSVVVEALDNVGSLAYRVDYYSSATQAATSVCEINGPYPLAASGSANANGTSSFSCQGIGIQANVENNTIPMTIHAFAGHPITVTLTGAGLTTGKWGYHAQLFTAGQIGPTGPTGPAGAAGGGNTTICIATASATVPTCPGNPAPTSLTGLMMTLVVQTQTSGAPATLNVAGLGAKNLYFSGSATSAINFIPVGTYQAYYDGTQIQVVQAGALPAGSAGCVQLYATSSTFGCGSFTSPISSAVSNILLPCTATSLTAWTVSGDGTGYSIVGGAIHFAGGNTNKLSCNVSVVQNRNYAMAWTVTSLPDVSHSFYLNLGVDCNSDCTQESALGANTYVAFSCCDSGASVVEIQPDDASSVFTVSAITITGAYLNTTLFDLASGTVVGYIDGSNTLLGFGALAVNQSYEETAIGHNSLASNTTGDQNTAVGDRALFSNTTGPHNAAFGQNALGGNTTGGYNTALGTGALAANITGSNNVAVGDGAGVGSADWTNNAQCVFIGGSANPTANNLTNCIAIGTNATVDASNHAVIGSSATTDVYFGSVSAVANAHATDFSSSGTAFTSLGAPSNGTTTYCPDCTVTSGIDNTCAGSGGGAWAQRINGAWKCQL